MGVFTGKVDIRDVQPLTLEVGCNNRPALPKVKNIQTSRGEYNGMDQCWTISKSDQTENLLERRNGIIGRFSMVAGDLVADKLAVLSGGRRGMRMPRMGRSLQVCQAQFFD